MTHLMKSLGLLVVGLACATSWAREFEGGRQDSVLLNGRWDFVFGDGREDAESAAGQRTITASEHMNDFGDPRTQWTGVDDRLANDLAVAQIGAEHTEAMRRARLDGILPSMYAGWTRTRLAARVKEAGQRSAVRRGGYAAPQSAAWHSSLSLVLASLDLFDPDCQTAQQVPTHLYLINDSWHEADVHVDLLLTKDCPE